MSRSNNKFLFSSVFCLALLSTSSAYAVDHEVGALDSSEKAKPVSFKVDAGWSGDNSITQFAVGMDNEKNGLLIYSSFNTGARFGTLNAVTFNNGGIVEEYTAPLGYLNAGVKFKFTGNGEQTPDANKNYSFKKTEKGFFGTIRGLFNRTVVDANTLLSGKTFSQQIDISNKNRANASITYENVKVSLVKNSKLEVSYSN